MKALSILLPLAFLIAGCSAGDHGAESARSESMKDMSGAKLASSPQPEGEGLAGGGYKGKVMRQPNRSEAPEAPPTMARQVIRRAELAIRVPNVEGAEREVNALVRSWQGYVESAGSTDLATDNPVLNMAIRVPVERFDSGIAKLESLGVRLSKTVSSEDVTGQIVDLDARLRTLRAQEETYRGLLRKATNLDSVISLQDKLTEVRGTIESMSAQRKTLGGLASLSSISLRLEQDASAHPAPKDPNWLAQIWGESTTSFGGALRVVTGLLVYVLVFSPFWLPLVWLARKAIRTERKIA